MSSRVLVLGGIRSGRSDFAQTLVAAAEQVRYLTTAPAAAQDTQVTGADRPTWTTEDFAADPYGLALRLSAAKPDETLLVDDLGGWLNSVFTVAESWHDAHAADDAMQSLAGALADCAAERVVLVSPEVGLSVEPATESARTFADALGRLNQLIAAACDEVALVVAGHPSWLKGGPGRPPPGVGRHAAEERTAAGTAYAPTVSGIAAAPERVDAAGAPDIHLNLDLPMPDETSVAGAQAHLASRDFPGAGLGALAAVVSFAAGTQRRAVPRPWERVRVLLLHAVHEGGVASGDDPQAAQRRLDQAHEGSGPIALLAAAAGASAGTVACPPAAAIELRDALSVDEVDDALATGWQLAEAAADEGTDALVLAAAGVGGEGAAAAVTALATGGEPAALLDRVATATGQVDDRAWMLRCAAVRDALHRIRARPRDPRSVLAMVGGGDVAVATGLILGAAYRRTPILIDGPVGIAAALMARDFGAQTRHWLLVPDHGGHPTVRLGADVLGATQLVHLRLRLGEGATALAALPLLRTALTLAAGTPASPPPPLRHDAPRWEVADFPTGELPLVQP